MIDRSLNKIRDQWPACRLFFKENKLTIIVFMSVMVFLTWVLVKNAWFGDDAFISIRVVDNFLNGYGLVWNAGERVQVFSHPLWLFLLILVVALLQDPVQSIYWLSLIVSLLTISLVFLKFAKTYKHLLFGGLMIASSMAFIDFSSSGLENPLTHLLLIVLLIVILKNPITHKTILYTAGIASLAAVNRLDTILFYLPILGYLIVRFRKDVRKSFIYLALGFLPLLGWEIFSLIYFGFPFPNTFYAKYSMVDLPPAWFHEHGWAYFKNSLQWDFITSGTILFSLGFIVWERVTLKLYLAGGLLLYLGYVYSIGGDFMAGRFLSAAFLMALVLLMTVDFSSLLGQQNYKMQLFGFIFLFILACAAEYPPFLTQYSHYEPEFGADGIANERLYYFNVTNWHNWNQANEIHEWGKAGMDLKEDGRKISIRGCIGFFGYYAGPDVYVLDDWVLSDPLRARLPAFGTPRIGHFQRVIPAGYIDTVMDAYRNHIRHPSLHLYYDKLDILIHQEVFSKGRFLEILKFNAGMYDYLLDLYIMSPGSMNGGWEDI